MERRLVLGLFGVVLLAATVAGAEGEVGFDCRLAKTKIETAICSSEEIRRFDAEMARAYRAVRDMLDPVAREYFEREHQVWLEHRNDACAEPFNDPRRTIAGCVEASIRRRTDYLMERLERLKSGVSNAAGGDLSSEQAYAICDDVIRLTNEGSIQGHTLSFKEPTDQEQEGVRRLNEDGKAAGVLSLELPNGTMRRFVSVYGGGTCADATIYELGARASSSHLERGIDLHGLKWGMEDALLLIRGQPVVITGSLSPLTPTYVLMVSWIGEGKKKPLCIFRPSGKVVMRVAPDAPRVCQDIAARRRQCSSVAVDEDQW